MGCETKHFQGYAMVFNEDTDCERISIDECQFVANKLGLTFETIDTNEYLPYSTVFEFEVDHLTCK